MTIAKKRTPATSREQFAGRKEPVTRSQPVGDRQVSTWAIRRLRTSCTGSGFAPVALGLAPTSAALAGLAPRAFSIATVFLFAGPHNWMEARYFLPDCPGAGVRCGVYFLLGLSGVLLLAAGSALLPWIGWPWTGIDQPGWLPWPRGNRAGGMGPRVDPHP